MKKNEIKCDLNQIERITNYCSVMRNEEKLKIEYNYWKYDRWGILMLNLVLVPIGIFLLIFIYSDIGFVMFFGFGGLCVYMIMLLTIGMPIFCFLSAFKNKEELILEKYSETLIKNKISKIFRQSKAVKFQEIKNIFYKAEEYEFSIRIVLQNYKEIAFFLGPEEECKIIGKTIADYLEKPLYFRSLGYNRKIPP